MKKLLKTLLACILAVATIFCFTGCNKDTGDLKAVKDAGKIVIGITDYKPMDYKDENGKWIGFDAELSEMFAKSLGVTCEFYEIVDWDNKVLEINSNAIDLIWNGMTASEELGKEIDFSVSYAKNAQVAVVKKGSSITTKDQIKNAQVAVENGSAGATIAEQEGMTNVNKPGNQKQALLEVLADTSDVAIIDITMAQSVVGVGEFADLQIVPGVSYGDEIFAVGLRKGSNLAEKLNKFLKDKYADGTMKALADKYSVGLNTDALSK
jgi:polar amino acid transport system substrate-binding protein